MDCGRKGRAAIADGEDETPKLFFGGFIQAATILAATDRSRIFDGKTAFTAVLLEFVMGAPRAIGLMSHEGVHGLVAVTR